MARPGRPDDAAPLVQRWVGAGTVHGPVAGVHAGVACGGVGVRRGDPGRDRGRVVVGEGSFAVLMRKAFPSGHFKRFQAVKRGYASFSEGSPVPLAPGGTARPSGFKRVHVANSSPPWIRVSDLLGYNPSRSLVARARVTVPQRSGGSV